MNSRRNQTFCLVLALLFSVLGCQKETISIFSADNSVNPNDFLSDKKYTSLVVEIQYVSGNQPTASSVENLKAFLQQRLNKPTGITVIQNAIVSPGKTVLSADDLQALEKAHRTQKTSNSVLTAWFFFADAGRSEERRVGKEC